MGDNWWNKIGEGGDMDPLKAMSMMGQLLFSFYNSLVNAGFTEQQAERMICSNVLGNMMASMGASKAKKDE